MFSKVAAPLYMASHNMLCHMLVWSFWLQDMKTHPIYFRKGNLPGA